MEAVKVKHTPGPWVCTSSKVRDEDDVEGGLEGYWYLLEGPGMAMCKANCDLIAAAPDMLEALRKCHFILKQHPDIYPHGESLAEQAIAKAEGRTE